MGNFSCIINIWVDIHKYTCVCVCVCVCVCIYIYIYIYTHKYPYKREEQWALCVLWEESDVKAGAKIKVMWSQAKGCQ